MNAIIKHRITTQIREPRPPEWRSAGTGLCSYRVRGVGGSCAKHLTVESYTVVMPLTFILIIVSIPSPSHSFIPFLQNLPTVAFLFFIRTDSTDSPDITDTSERVRVLIFSFFCFPLFSCRFRAVD